jgi:hypothetical protein
MTLSDASRVQVLIENGAKDRETAIRWIDDAYGDLEFLCFYLDLPYGYFK